MDWRSSGRVPALQVSSSEFETPVPENEREDLKAQDTQEPRDKETTWPGSWGPSEQGAGVGSWEASKATKQCPVLMSLQAGSWTSWRGEHPFLLQANEIIFFPWILKKTWEVVIGLYQASTKLREQELGLHTLLPPLERPSLLIFSSVMGGLINASFSGRSHRSL
jgi:hypothetical protein